MNSLPMDTVAVPPELFDQLDGCVCLFDENGRLQAINAAGEQLAGAARQDLRGLLLADIWPELTGSRLLEEFGQLLGSEGTASCVVPVLLNGSEMCGHGFAAENGFWLLLKTHYERSRQASVAAVSVAEESDASSPGELRQLMEQLRRNQSTFYNLIHNDPFGVYVVDADFRLREVSEGSQKVFSTVRPLLGRDFAEVLRQIWTEPFATEAIGRFRHTLETGESYSAPSTVKKRQDIDVVEAYDWRIMRVTLPDGRYGVVCYFYDLSERQKLEEALRESEQRQADQKEALELAVGGAPISDVLNALARAGQRQMGADSRTAIFITHPEHACVHIGASAGLSVEYTSAVDGFSISADSPSCGLAVFTGNEVIVRDVSEDPNWAPYVALACKHRIRAAWSFPVKASEGATIGTFAVYHDAPREPQQSERERMAMLAQTTSIVLERHRAETALRESEKKYRQLFDSMSEGFLLLEFEESQACPASSVFRLIEANTAFERITGLKRETVIGRDLRDILPGIEAQWTDAFARAAGTGVPERIEHFNGDLNAWFQVFAYSPQTRRLALIWTNVTDRKRAEEALSIAKAAAEQASRAKSVFLANVSHELRTPLNAIKGFSEMILEEEGCASQVHADVRSIIESANHLLDLINSVLDLARIEAGRVELSPRRFDVEEVAVWCVQMVAPAAAQNRNSISLRYLPESATMKSDMAKVRQILLNLLGNAVKFTRDGAVELTVERQDVNGVDSIIFEVRDNGIGIPPGDQSRIFEAFVQGDTSCARQFEGSGLGLAITRRLCVLLGGSVSFSSAVGEGSCFRVVLPASVAG